MDKEKKPVGQANLQGMRLKRERERRGWSQEELADLIGTTQVNVSRWERGKTLPIPHFRKRLAAAFERTLEELGLVTEIEQQDQARIEASAGDNILTLLPVWNVPYQRNPFFTGRSAVLEALAELFERQQTAALTQAQAISGLGGIGKTQVAVEYAYRARERYQAVLWVTASTRGTLMADFVALAELLGLPERREQDQYVVVAAVRRWLATHERWLLILDNVEDAEVGADLLPAQHRGHLLLTTRLQALGALAHSIEIEKMGLEEGTTLLLRRAKMLSAAMPLARARADEREQAEIIVRELDGLPLALDQAGAYLEETRCGFAIYQKLYQTHRKELLQRRGSLSFDHPAPVATTWSLSFQRITNESPAAVDLLHLCAFLSPEAIPEEVLEAGAEELGPALGAVAGDTLELNATLERLLRYSLIWRTPERGWWSLHRLVQAVLRDHMGWQEQVMWVQRATLALNRAFPEVELNTWEQCRRCLPHVLVCAGYLEEYGLAFAEAGRVLTRAAYYLSTHAQYGQAEKLLRQALAIRKQALAAEHPEMAMSLNDLGMLYLAQGKYQQAGPLLEEALRMREQVLSQQHPATAASLHNLGVLYSTLGKYEQAEACFRRALQIRQQVLEKEHPEIAQSQSYLAELYTAQGKYEEAEALYGQARHTQEKKLELPHPDIARTLNGLALLYRSRGEYERAEALYQQALGIQENLFGPDHPDVAQTIYNLARLYRAQGRYAQAEPCYTRALQIREEVFGREHPQVAYSLYGLAKLYNSQGRYQEAEVVGMRALDIQEQVLGQEHPNVSYTLGMLAKIYQGQQRLEEASVLNQRALRIREQTSDANHPHLALLSNNQAEIYHAQGKREEAEPLIRRSLAIYQQILSASHPYMAYSLSNLAQNHFLGQEYTQAEILFKQALLVREQSLGKEHPRTASTYYSLARLYHKLGRYDEAEELYCRAQEVREHALGMKHPTVMNGLTWWAQFLRERGRSAEADDVEARVQQLSGSAINLTRDI